MTQNQVSSKNEQLKQGRTSLFTFPSKGYGWFLGTFVVLILLYGWFIIYESVKAPLASWRDVIYTIITEISEAVPAVFVIVLIIDLAMGVFRFICNGIKDGTIWSWNKLAKQFRREPEARLQRWEDWSIRRQRAIRRGEEFNEPPPSDDA